MPMFVRTHVLGDDLEPNADRFLYLAWRKSFVCSPVMRFHQLPLFVILGCAQMTAAAPASLPIPVGAVDRISNVQVVVAPDRRDWTYRPGDDVTFTATVLFDGQPLSGAEITYRVGPEKWEADPVTKILPEGSGNIAGGTLQEPGFLRCVVETKVGSATYRSLATAGFDPLQIQPTQIEPADFDAFWQESLIALGKIPADLHKKLVPEASTGSVNVYHVNFQVWSGGGMARMYGMLAEPKAPGRYPAILQVPGAGVRAYTGNVELAAKGAIVLRVGIHSIPVDLPGSIYDDLRKGALQGYPTFRLDDKNSYYYRRVYLGCVRANDILTAHPLWDGKTLVVQGGSQGGQLSIVTTALDPRVTGLVCHYPAYCDVTGYLHHRAGGWPHLFREENTRSAEQISTTAYFDAVNFARRLRVPGVFSWGYNDETCPPTSLFAAYNSITSPKELILQLNMGHGSSREFSAASEASVMKMAGLAAEE